MTVFTWVLVAAVWVGPIGNMSATQTTVEFFENKAQCGAAVDQWRKDYSREDTGWAAFCQKVDVTGTFKKKAK